MREAAAGESEAGDRRTLSPRVRIVWSIHVVAVGVMVTVAAAAAASALTWIPPALPVVIGLVILVAGLAWVVLRYRAWGFEVRNDELYLQRGVVTHVRTIAPYVRIQHVDTQRGPLERWLGLSTLVVYTAGSRGADVSIPGLTATEARDLQSRLKQLSIAAEGGDAV